MQEKALGFVETARGVGAVIDAVGEDDDDHAATRNNLLADQLARLQNLLVAEVHNRINAAHDPDVISMPIGQIVGRMNEVRPVADVMADLVREYDETVSRLEKIRG